MAYDSLSSFVERLDREGELLRIREPAQVDLEIAAAADVEHLVCSAAVEVLAVIHIPHRYINAKCYYTYTIRISLHTVSSCIMALYRM